MKSLFFESKKRPILQAKYDALNQYGRCVTRRLIKPKPVDDARLIQVGNTYSLLIDGEFKELLKPPYRPGEIAYWREPFVNIAPIGDKPIIIYRIDADIETEEIYNWQSPCAMKEEYARTLVEIVSCEPERFSYSFIKYELYNFIGSEEDKPDYVLEGGQVAADYLKAYDGMWVWRIEQKLVEHE